MSSNGLSDLNEILERVRRARALTREPPVVPLAALDPLGLQWLWPGRFALGKVSLLIGAPDCGKSLLACALAAHVSTGRRWPDGAPCAQGKVLLLAGED